MSLLLLALVFLVPAVATWLPALIGFEPRACSSGE